MKYLAIFLIPFFLFAPIASAAVAFDTSVKGTICNPCTTNTFSITLADASDVIVIQAFTGAAATGVTVNGAAATAVGGDNGDDGSGRRESNYIFLGATTTVNQIVYSAGSGFIAPEAQDYSGADRTTNPTANAKSNTASAAAPTVSITGVTGGAIVGIAEAAGGSGGVTTGVTGGTERQHDSAATNGGWGDIIGAGSGAYTATMSGGPWTQIAVMAMVLQPTQAATTLFNFGTLTFFGWF